MGINVKGSKGAVHMYPWLANLTGQLVEDRRGCVELMRLTFTAATYYYYYYYYYSVLLLLLLLLRSTLRSTTLLLLRTATTATTHYN